MPYRRHCSLSHNTVIGINALDGPFTKLDNLCAVFEGGETVGDNEYCEIFAETFNGLHDRLLGFVV